MPNGVITSAALEGKEPVETKPAKSGFETMRVDELREIAENFGVEVKESDKKPMILAALAEEGVTFEDYNRLTNAEHEEPEQVVEVKEVTVEKKRVRSEKDVLVKMTRDNYYFETYGKVFTKEHPFAVMSEDEAQQIFDAHDGFTVATPREAAEYYS